MIFFSQNSRDRTGFMCLSSGERQISARLRLAVSAGFAGEDCAPCRGPANTSIFARISDQWDARCNCGTRSTNCGTGPQSKVGRPESCTVQYCFHQWTLDCHINLSFFLESHWPLFCFTPIRIYDRIVEPVQRDCWLDINGGSKPPCFKKINCI